MWPINSEFTLTIISGQIVGGLPVTGSRATQVCFGPPSWVTIRSATRKALA